MDIWEEVWRKCGKVWKIYPIVGTVNSVAIWIIVSDNDWVYGYYNLISRILILAAINNGSGKGRRNGT